MIRLLLVGDIHLGKRISGVPGGIPFSPALAWQRTIDYALECVPDAVLLAGDVVQQENDFFEAYADLSTGVQRLHAAGISVLGVAGNHDVEVLPRLARAIPHFHLLGADGVWECFYLRSSAGEEVAIYGWSFPDKTYRTSPLLLDFPAPPGEVSSCPTVGLLHCDRDQTRSRYAPVRSLELEQAPVDAWFLGHIHKPDPLIGKRPCGYLGSLMGLDASEVGDRGPWWVEIEPRGITARHIPLAPLRWERLDVRLNPTTEMAEIPELIISALYDLHETLMAKSHRPEIVGCRVYLIGRHANGPELAQWLEANEPHTLRDERDGVCYFIDRIQIRSHPDLDLQALSSGFDPVALIAQKILALRDPQSAQAHELIVKARARFTEIAQRPVFAALTSEPMTDADIAETLERLCLDALERLLATAETSK